MVAHLLRQPALLQVLLILFIIAQGPKGEGMINSLNGVFFPPLMARVAPDACLRARPCPLLTESRMLGNFSQTKNFVTVGTWALVGLFLALSAIVALKHD